LTKQPGARPRGPRTLGALVLLAVMAAVACAGCGSSGSSSSAGSASAAAREAREQNEQSESAAHGETSSTPTVSTTTASVSTGSPELILCREEQLDSPALLALSGGSEGVSVTTLVSFSGADQTTDCSISPDLTKLAEQGGESEEFTVAGYLPASSGSFVNLSGNKGNSYSGSSVDDERPMFNPVSGELWWTSEGHIWSAPVSGGTPQDHGAGRLEAFSTSGEPLPDRVAPSPDGSMGAIANDTEDVGDGEALGLAIGKASALTASCLNRAGAGAAVAIIASHCPGVGSLSFPEGNRLFIGFVSDSAFICEDISSEGPRFDLIMFKIMGSRVKIVSDAPLTPPTTREVGWAAVSPDGKRLWYTATGGASTQESPEQSTQSPLYVVSASSPTSNPSPVSVSPAGSVVSADKAIGWRWNGQWLDGAP
jgi:hypothetical protein